MSEETVIATIHFSDTGNEDSFCDFALNTLTLNHILGDNWKNIAKKN